MATEHQATGVFSGAAMKLARGQSALTRLCEDYYHRRISADDFRRERARLLASLLDEADEFVRDAAPASGGNADATDPAGDTRPLLVGSGDSAPQPQSTGRRWLLVVLLLAAVAAAGLAALALLVLM